MSLLRIARITDHKRPQRRTVDVFGRDTRVVCAKLARNRGAHRKRGRRFAFVVRIIDEELPGDRSGVTVDLKHECNLIAYVWLEIDGNDKPRQESWKIGRVLDGRRREPRLDLFDK